LKTGFYLTRRRRSEKNEIRKMKNEKSIHQSNEQHKKYIGEIYMTNKIEGFLSFETVFVCIRFGK
jgi:hypothetical protein